MRKVGLCDYCQRPALASCPGCGRMVCGNCFIPDERVCRSCARGKHQRSIGEYAR